MATNTEQIQELSKDVILLKERVEALRIEILPLREIQQQLTVIEHRLDEMTKTKNFGDNEVGWSSPSVCLRSSRCWWVFSEPC